jgi:endoglucanase
VVGPDGVSEFGTCITWLANQCHEDDVNFSYGIRRYLKEGDIDWAYWQLNGTQSDSLFHPGHRKLRHHGALDWYGLLSRRWDAPTDARNAERIKALQKMTQHP